MPTDVGVVDVVKAQDQQCHRLSAEAGLQLWQSSFCKAESVIHTARRLVSTNTDGCKFIILRGNGAGWVFVYEA
jgi:hypothetical protein